MAYDHQFWQQVTAGCTATWSELNLSPMVATVFATGDETPTWACQLCVTTCHSSCECALASLEGNKASPRLPASNWVAAHPRPYRIWEEVCRCFNRRTCTSSSCTFEHTCATCQQPSHGSFECRKMASKGSTQDPPPSSQDPASSNIHSPMSGLALMPHDLLRA